jgi:RNA polymerase sigma-70 factor (sigma-E family)
MHTLTGAGVAMGGRTRTRDEEFSAYMAARQPSLMRTAYLLTGNQHQAEDLVQTSLAKLYLAWDRVHDRESVDAYVRRILVNEHNSVWRRAWKRREVATDRPPEAPTRDEYDEGRSAALWDVVQTLPKRARAVVVLRYYEELTEAETADLLGISVGTVKSQASRALAALRERAPQELDPRIREEER